MSGTLTVVTHSVQAWSDLVRCPLHGGNCSQLGCGPPAYWEAPRKCNLRCFGGCRCLLLRKECRWRPWFACPYIAWVVTVTFKGEPYCRKLPALQKNAKSKIRTSRSKLQTHCLGTGKDFWCPEPLWTWDCSRNERGPSLHSQGSCLGLRV